MSYLTSYRFEHTKKGPNVLILGAVHGNEPCGASASKQVIGELNEKKRALLCGSVTFIPVCNPKAFERQVREVDENLNRIIAPYPNPKTYEQHLADELDTFIKNADVIIDLHSTFCPLGKPFIFSDYPDPLADRLTAAQNVRYILKGWPEVYALNNAIEDLSTGACAHKYGKTALTVECGHHFDPAAHATAYQVILRTLQTLGLFENMPYTPVKQEYVRMDTLILKEKEGRLVREFNHLDHVSKGEILGLYDDGTTLCAPQDGYVLLPKPYAKPNAEWFYLGHLEESPVS